MVLNTIQIIISLDSKNVDALTNKDVTLAALYEYYTAIKYCESPLAIEPNLQYVPQLMAYVSWIRIQQSIQSIAASNP